LQLFLNVAQLYKSYYIYNLIEVLFLLIAYIRTHKTYIFI